MEASLRRTFIPHHKKTKEVCWGGPEEDIEFVEYFWRSASFGDIAASTLLYCVLHKAAERFGEDQETKYWFSTMSYVDDLTAGHFTIEGRDKIMEGIDKILERSAIKHCPWTLIQPPSEMPSIPPTKDELEGAKKILGYSYISSHDAFVLKYAINLNSFKRGKPEGPSLLPGENVRAYVSQHRITRRLIARTAMSIWDSQAVLIAAQMQARSFFRDALLYDQHLKGGWDQEVSLEIREKFIVLIEDLMSLDGYLWPRLVIPEMGFEVNEHSPMLAVSVDGSSTGSAALVHLVTERKNGDPLKTKEEPNCVSLIKGIGRVASADGNSVPRLELQSLILGLKAAELSLIHI